MVRSLQVASCPPSEEVPVIFADARSLQYPAKQLEHAHWYALRTRARHEKRTHDLLQAAGHESFAAVARVERTWSDRTCRVGMPLFAGYIFVRTALSRIGDVLRWPGAVDLVRTDGVPAPVRGEEMASVMRLAHGVDETGRIPCDVDYLEPGARVRVEGGPFDGMVGRLLGERGRNQVAIRLDALRLARAVSVGRRFLVRLAD